MHSPLSPPPSHTLSTTPLLSSTNSPISVFPLPLCPSSPPRPSAPYFAFALSLLLLPPPTSSHFPLNIPNIPCILSFLSSCHPYSLFSIPLSLFPCHLLVSLSFSLALSFPVISLYPFHFP